MSYDTRIALMGQQPDIVGAIGQGLQTGQLRNEIGTQNALRDLYQAQGAQIAQGDPNALAALAGISPQMSLGIEESRLGMDATRQTMSLQREAAARARAAGARAAQTHAQGLSAAQVAEEREQIAQGLATAIPALRSGDLNGVNQILRTAGLEAADSLESAGFIIAQYEGALEGFDAMQGVMGTQAQEPDDARAVEIQRLMATQGLTQEQATAIAYGVVRSERDPVTGEQSFVNMADAFASNAVPTQAQQPVTPQPAPTQPPSVFNQPAPVSQPPAQSVLPPDVDLTSTLGASGAVRNAVNFVTDFAAGVRVFDEAGEARTALDNARTRTLTTLSTVTVPGRPSNYVMEMFNQNVVGNGTFSGPAAARDTAAQTLAFLEGMVRENQLVLNRRVSPAVRSEAQRNLAMLEGLAADYEVIVRGLSGRQEQRGGSAGNVTSTGVEWSIVE